MLVSFTRLLSDLHFDTSYGRFTWVLGSVAVEVLEYGSTKATMSDGSMWEGNQPPRVQVEGQRSREHRGGCGGSLLGEGGALGSPEPVGLEGDAQGYVQAVDPPPLGFRFESKGPSQIAREREGSGLDP